MKAKQILQEGIDTMNERAAERGQHEERVMANIVWAFNALTGHDLKVSQGWLFMTVLKAARAENGTMFRKDDYMDGANYFALYGEEVSAEKPTSEQVKLRDTLSDEEFLHTVRTANTSDYEFNPGHAVNPAIPAENG